MNTAAGRRMSVERKKVHRKVKQNDEQRKRDAYQAGE